MRKYDWAIDTLIEALAALNKGYVEMAQQIIRAAVWDAAGRPDTDNNNKAVVVDDPANTNGNSIISDASGK